MKTIKKFKTQDKKNYLTYLINGEKYRAYEIGSLPAKFGTWNFNDREGIGKWFNCVDTGTGHSGEGMEVNGVSEHDAILNVVDILRIDCDFISKIINVKEIIK